MWAEFAPAKINLTLDITGKREDGYHTLESLIVFVTCGDHICVAPSDKSQIKITGPFSEPLQALEGDNLALKALQAAERELKKPLNLEVTLQKNLPVASGIGGGSADAAAMLRMLRRITGGQIKDQKWREIAISLGADVPVCLESIGSWVNGIGDIVQPVNQVPDFGIVLVNPMKSLATKDVFAAWEGGGFSGTTTVPKNLARSAFKKFILSRENMLEGTAKKLIPEIKPLLEAIGNTPDCFLARMSGSGATCYGLYETRETAEIAAAILTKIFPDYWVAAAQLFPEDVA